MGPSEASGLGAWQIFEANVDLQQPASCTLFVTVDATLPEAHAALCVGMLRVIEQSYPLPAPVPAHLALLRTRQEDAHDNNLLNAFVYNVC